MRRRRSGLNFGRQRRRVNMNLVREIFTWMIEIFVVVAIAFVLVYFVGMRTSVVGQSMEPMLEAGDEVLVNRFVYKVSQPKAGDVIIFLPNGNQKSHYYIRRVVGVPGDTIQIKNGILYRNGEEYDVLDSDSEAENYMDDAGIASEEIVVGEDEYFVLGDNRNNSEDSRFSNIGNISKEYIIGKAWYITSPFDKLGFM